VFDPLAGGGTTLFTALVLGADAAGVEQNAQDVQTTAAFLAQFLREQRISHRQNEERLKGLGQRWSFSIGKKNADQIQRCTLARGDTEQSVALLDGFKPHLIVADLPYGIQHHGQLTDLLANALPVWESLLPPSGTLALAWDATRFPRAEMRVHVESVSGLRVLTEPPYPAWLRARLLLTTNRH